MNATHFLALTALVAMCAGCASARTADNARVGSPKVYGGTRVNLAALSGDEHKLDVYQAYGIEPPAYPTLDLLPSFVLDTALFPAALGYTVTEPLVGRK